MIKRRLKRTAQSAIARVAPLSWKMRRSARLLVLMYHRILPHDHPELPIIQPGMVVTAQTFGMHMRVLKRHFEVMHLDDWIERVRANQPVPRLCCAVTLDDGWRDNFDYGYPLLRAAGVPATIFLVSDMVGRGESFWPERVARLLWRGGAGQPPEVWGRDEFIWLTRLGAAYDFSARAPRRDEIDELIGCCKRFTDAELGERLTKMESGIAPESSAAGADLLDWDQINEMAASGIIRFGSHTRHHVRLLDTVDPGVLRDEIGTSRRVIEAKTGGGASLFCYPNGNYTADTKRLVQEYYAAACTTRKGWNTPETDRYQLRRIGVHEDVAADETAFIARLSGWL